MNPWLAAPLHLCAALVAFSWGAAPAPAGGFPAALPSALPASSPFRLGVDMTPTPFRFRYDTTTQTRSASADRSGEDLRLGQDGGNPRLVLTLETDTPWRFDLEHFKTSAAEQAALSRKQYLFNHFPVTVNADVHARVSVENLKLVASRALVTTPWSSLGLDLGLGITRAAWSLASTNPEVGENLLDRGTLALPLLGLRAEFRPSSRIRWALKGDYFSLARTDTRGRALSFKGELEYRPTRALALNAGIAHASLGATLRGSAHVRDIELTQGGPYLGLRYQY